MYSWQILFLKSMAGQTLLDCGYGLSYSKPRISIIEKVAYELHIKNCHFYSRHFLMKRK